MPLPSEPIVISADRASRWQEGQYDVMLLSGSCQIQQGMMRARSRDAVIWLDRGNPYEQIPTKVIAYLESDVFVEFDDLRGKQRDTQWLGRFHTLREVKLRLPEATPPPRAIPPLVRRGFEARQFEAARAVQQAQFTAPPLPSEPNAGSFPSVNVVPRGQAEPEWQSFQSANPNEMIHVVSGGVRVVVQQLELPGLESGIVSIEADRIVGWMTSRGAVSGLQAAQSAAWEFYLEGNIVFREGERIIYADRMYYDVDRRQGMILNAEALTPASDYEGLMRLKADVLHQLDQQNFLAYGAAITSSRMGVPSYWLQAESIALQHAQTPRVDPFTGQASRDPFTNEVDVEHHLFATSRSNAVFIGGFPVLYWPIFATDLTEPTFYVDGVRFGSDSVFGLQAMLDWDLFQLLGMENPLEDGKWTLSTDYLSERGFGLGTNLEYRLPGLLQFPGEAIGQLDAWGIHDNGLDNLGLDRRALVPEEEFRGRIRWQHRQHLPGGFQFTGELGLISDRNFLEQYFEEEWDQFKDQSTRLELKRYLANSSWSITGQTRLNDFFTQTEWLPRFEHHLLGQSLFHDRLTWYAHSHVGYAKLQPAVAPTNLSPAAAKFDPLAWERPREGLHAGTRQEIDMPLQVGPLKVVPYTAGELLRVGEDLAGVERTRALGQTGARTSLSWWRADPQVQSTLLNLNGLAHKVEWESDFFYADADEDLTDFPLYEPLDDDAVEFFRRRFFFDTFGGAPGGDVPLRFDERTYALRSGMQRYVSARSSEIADDLVLFRTGLRQRWQTKRGRRGHERIIDWIVLDVEGTYFPDADRDNFGQEFGLLNYDFRWHVGDRLTFLSDGFADLFADGLRTFSLGGVITRPERGRAYLGFRTIEGPVSSNILTGSVSYRMSEKWILTGGTSVDFGAAGNIGQYLGVTRIGESALVRIGFNADRSRDNIGVSFAIEPRFLPRGRLGRVGGVQLPPAGAQGLE